MARPLTTPAELTGELSPDAALRRIVAARRSDLNKYRAVVLAGSRPIGVHQSRVALRRLRAAIGLRPLFSGPGFDSKVAKPYIEATARLQGALGALNDRAVAAQIIADIAQAARPSELAKKPLERVARQVKAGTKRDKHRIGRAWKTFRKAEPFWRM